MSFHVTYNFVQGYDAGQKKIVASEVDQNFSDIEGYINNSSVNIADPQTITGDKVFTGTVDLSGATVISSDNIPVGSIIWSANATVPAGYLLCNGASVGRETYPELFAAIGTTYGEGDGSTTFNLPNLIGRFLEGAITAGTVKEAGLPNITGKLNWSLSGNAGANGEGALYWTGAGTYATTAAGYYPANPGFDASRSSPIYGASTTVQPPSVTALPCIKAFSAVIGDATVVAGQLVNDIQSKVALDGSNVSSIGSTLSTYMAHAAMPSNRKIEITVTGNVMTYTAPADGYVTAGCKRANMSNSVFLWINDDISTHSISPVGDWETWSTLPVSAGTVMNVVFYSDDGIYDWRILRFVYANGSAPTV